MQTRSDFNAVLLIPLLNAAGATEAQVPPELAKRYFEEATKLCERDAKVVGTIAVRPDGDR